MLEVLYKLKTDNELMIMLQSGNEVCLKILFCRHSQDLLNFCFWMTGKRELAEDVCQEAFLKVFLKREQFNSNFKFKNWLISICRNLIIDVSRKKSETLLEQDHLENIVSNDLSIEYLLDNKWSKEQIYSQMLKINSDQREALSLWLQGMSTKDISNIMGKSEQACKNLINRAKNNLINMITCEVSDERLSKSGTFKKIIS